MIGRRLGAVIRHPIAQNVLALGTVQVAITVVPLITLPYLARVLDRSELGLVIIVQTFSFLVALVVEYGFALSATRDVATTRDDPGALAATAAGVLGAKLLLAAGAGLVALVLWPLVPIFSGAPDLLGYGLALGVTQGFFPVWFFLGLERTRPLALLQLASRLASLVLIVVLVRDSSDGELVLAIYVLTGAAATACGMGLMYRRVPVRRPSGAGTLDALRRGRTLFVGTGAIAVYTGANAFLLGLIVPAAQVAIFAAPEKLVRAGNRVLALSAQAVYPRVSLLLSRGAVARANRLSGLSLLVFGATALAAGGLLAIFAPLVIEVVFGPGFEDSVPLLRIMALLLPLNVVGVALSTQWLLPRGLDRRVSVVVLAAAALNAALVVAAAELADLQAAAWALVAVELFVVAGYSHGLRRALAGR